MKAFEDWWSGHCVSFNAHRRLFGVERIHKDEAWKIWQACIEWSLNEDDGVGCTPEKLEEELQS